MKQKKKPRRKYDRLAYELKVLKQTYLHALQIHVNGYRSVDMEAMRPKIVRQVAVRLGRWPAAADFAGIRRPAGVHLVDRQIDTDLAALLPLIQPAIDDPEPPSAQLHDPK